MIEKETGGPAFARPGAVFKGPNGQDMGNEASLGMSLRDYFAAKAMQSLIVDPDRADQSREECARLSYAMADAMLRAREAS